jgi:hypothetical protein
VPPSSEASERPRLALAHERFGVVEGTREHVHVDSRDLQDMRRRSVRPRGSRRHRAGVYAATGAAFLEAQLATAGL